MTSQTKDLDMLRAKKAIKELLSALGLSLADENLRETPDRVARMWVEFCTPEGAKLKSFPLTTKTGLIVFKNHQAWGFCPHHLLPVQYTFKVGYLPKGSKVIGASKVPRLVNQILSLMPLQEEIPGLVGQALIGALNPKGVGIILKGEHMCTRIRGVRSSCLEMINTFMWGDMLEEGPTRAEFMTL